MGLTIVAWIALVGGILGIASGLIVIAVGLYLPGLAVERDMAEPPALDRDAAGLLSDPEFAEFMVRAGVYSAIISAAFAAVGAGILKRAKWAWKLSIGMMVIMIAISISSLFVDFIRLPSYIIEMYEGYSVKNLPVLIASVVINIGVYIFVIYYLFRPHVRRYLRR